VALIFDNRLLNAGYRLLSLLLLFTAFFFSFVTYEKSTLQWT